MNRLDFVRAKREAAIQTCDDLRARIEELEAQVRAADALAEQVQGCADILGGYDGRFSVTKALTTYRATKEGGA